MGSGTPSPDAIPGLLVWVESDSGVSPGTNNQPVDSWADKSAAGNSLAMTGNARPYFIASDVNLGGKPSLTCSTAVGPFAHKGMKSTGLVFGPFTKFFLVSGHVTGAGYYDFHYTDANNGDYTFSSANGLYCARSSTKSERNPGTNWGAYGATTFKTQTIQFDGTNAGYTLAINGVAQTLTAGGFSGNPGTGTLAQDWYMGVDSSLGTSTGSRWAAVLIYDRVLTAGQVAAVESYLKTKYGHY